MSPILCLVLATAISIQTINGQTIRSHIICDVDEVIVNVNSSGVIQHVHRDSSTTPCTLLLSGFVSGGYVSIPGVDTVPSFGGCDQDTVTVNINNVPYCVKDDQSRDYVIVKLTNEQLNITLPSADVPDFELNYYSNVAVCGTDLKIPDGAKVNQLSGVISSSFHPMQNTVPSVCALRLIGIPNITDCIKFELLYKSTSAPLFIGNEQFTTGNPRGDTLLVSSGSGRTINVSYTPAEFDDFSFVLKFTVLHCGDIPAIPYSTNSTTATPWLPGSMVAYACVDGWKLEYDTNSTIECVVDVSREIAVWSDYFNIQCIPEPWCHSPPNVIDNSTYILREDNLTATYQCIDGYTTNSSVSDRTINCTSSDKDTTPWTWDSPPSFVCTPEPWCHSPPTAIENTTCRLGEDNLTATYQCVDGYITNSSVSDGTIKCTSSDRYSTPWTWSSPPSFVCTPVECNLTSVYQNITNGNVTNKRYYYTQQLQYQCDVGYMRAEEVVECTINGRWSVLPVCVPTTSTSSATSVNNTKFIITVSASSSGGLVLLVVIAVLGVCLYRRRARFSGPKTSTNGVTSVTEQGPDVTLDSVDEMSPYATTTSLSPTSLPSASNYPDNSATYADVQKIIGRPSPAPARAEHPTGPLYEEAPILPPRLEDKPVEMVDNNLYAAQEDVAPPQGAATAESVEMLENNLYGSGY